MGKIVKKYISVILVSMVLISSIPFLQSQIPGLEMQEVHAAAASSGIEYLDAKHAKALIGFIYDVSELTDDMLNAGGMYKFITGGYTEGSVEEIAARIAFLTAAKANISKCMGKYDAVVENSYNQLLDTLTDMAVGDIDDGLANDVLDDVVDSVEDIFLTLSKTGEEVGEALKTVKASYSSIASIPDKLKKMKQGMEVALSSFFHVWGSNRSNMYTYVNAYISNRPLKDSCPSAFEATMTYNIYALNQKVLIYDPILDWASDEHLEVLNTFGDFIYQVQKSLVNYVSYSQTYKTYEVHCPTDVYLYNEDGSLALSIVQDIVNIETEGVYAAVYEGEKIVTVPSDQQYTLKITGTDSGVMDYKVSEYSAGSMVRFVEFNDLPVEVTTEYVDVLPQEINVSKDEYSLTNEENQIFTADYDSLPETAGNIADVVVAEELFKDFPEELIQATADVLFNMEKKLDLSSYDVKVDDAVALFSALAKYYPSEYSLIVNGDFTYQIVYDSKTEKMTEMRFDYGKDADLSKFKARVTALKEKIDSIVSELEGLDDFEKALYVHDFIILNCEYDLELMELLDAQGKLSGEIRSERYTEYSVLVNKTGICGSYALAYRAIMNAAGVDCIYVSSAQMNHAWNMVKINGKWYHVDCCWDDPMPDGPGRAMRTYFLRTDKEMMNLNHYSWTPTQYKATSEKYLNLPRKNNDVLTYDDANDCWYELSFGYLYRMNQDGSDDELIASGLDANAIECDQGKLYLIEDSFIYEVNTETFTKLPVYYMSSYDAGAEPEKAYLKNAVINGNAITVYKYIMEYVESGDDYVLEPVIQCVEDVLHTDRLASVTGVVIEDVPEQMELFETAYPYAYLTSTGEHEIWDFVIEWESSNENVVSVNEYGELKANNAGTATVTASFMDFESSVTITVAGNEDSPSGSCGTNITWSYDPNSGVLILTGSGEMTNYSYTTAPWYDFISGIKEVKVGSGITSIGNYSFAYADQLTKVTLPDGLTSIGDTAFLYCTSLLEADIPSSVTSIGDSAFHTCISLLEVNLPAGLTVLEDSAFERCDSIESIVIPSKIKKIGEYTFESCESLKYLDLNQVESIERNAFDSCTSLTELNIPASMSIMGQGAFEKCTGLKTVTIEGNRMTLISSDVFSGCTSLENIELPASLSYISSSLFQNCTSLKSITIPSSVTSIENHAFSGCSSLAEIVIPKNVSSISNQSTFERCSSLLNFVVDENNPNYTSVDGVLFNKSMTTLVAYPAGKTESQYTVPNGVELIDWNAFYYNLALESVVLPDTVTCIEGNAFAQMKNLNTIVMSENLEVISGGTFAGDKSLKQIELPETLTTLERGAFSECTSLTSIVIPDGVTLIDQWTFQDCTSLKSVILPKNLTSIGYNVFDGCDELVHVGYKKSQEEFNQLTVNYGNDPLLNAEHFHYDFDLINDVTLTEPSDPSCTEDGRTESLICNECDFMLSGEMIPALGHDYQETDHKDGSCTEVAYDEYTCSRCDDTYKEYGNVREGHDYSKTVVEPTCTQKGYTIEVCTKCQESSISDFISPKGHQLSVVKTEDYCQNHGTYEYQCEHCDYSEFVTTVDTASTHTVVVEATCTQSGTSKEICDLCEATVSSTILSPTGHSYSEDWTIDVEATCKEPGLKSKHCADCDAKTEITVIEIASDQHGETTLINVKEASCSEEGYSGDYKCNICDQIAIKGEVLETLSHEPQFTAGKTASCTEAGWKDYYECECGKYFEDENAQVPIESLETWKQGTGKVSAEHDLDLSTLLNDETGHWHKCRHCDYTDEVKPHTPDRVQATEAEPVLCTECEYKIQDIQSTGYLQYVKMMIDGQETIKENLSEVENNGKLAKIAIVHLDEKVDSHLLNVDDYLFAGFFSSIGCTKETSIHNLDEHEGELYAKFVTEAVMNIKVQASGGIRNSEAGALRIITTVDSLCFEEVGFKVEIEDVGTKMLSSRTVYSTLSAKKSDGSRTYYYPTMISDESKYFLTALITGIPTRVHNNKFNITPYWKTYDGTVVYGETQTKVISELPGY